MSKESSVSARFQGRSASSNENFDANEDGFGNSLNFTNFPPSRSPLNSIPDPSQYQREAELDPLEAPRPQHGVLGKKIEVSEITAGNVTAQYQWTPSTTSRHGKCQSEPNSAHSTPARSGSRVSLGGGGFTTNFKVAQYPGGRGMVSSSKISRATSIGGSDFSLEIPYFELNEDPSFWQEHNVQVLIRIRPLSPMERNSQGYGRCLKQESANTLVWLGHPETTFTFDHVACETISQEKLFRVAGVPMVENCMSGYNSCMFAYGQTGSGKTYTMMGEIGEIEGKLNQHCGITPRVFEYLFSRIRMEEEGRREEKLVFTCKCSFLEIYNEQITDLLEASSTNLQLREDTAKGVYVENLTEYNVRTVDDVLKLLLQGTANRKMAATHMNSGSSRSHSVFTCIIESRWEKDSLTHFRFARLNLVDLAGSERQKSSGAEGDRLKEAANINKSLSTLGLVIMSLVDLAHGKHRHVPYRDSRLTFLLQDSLGGNSKTMIIANVSPSLCSANETLSTLKFAQRAKLIQNNAKVNEDASGDVTVLQQEIKELKNQLSSLMKSGSFPTALPACATKSRSDAYSEACETLGERRTESLRHEILKIKNMEATLAGALRREKAAETALQKSEGEIEHMSRLVRQKEEDAQRTKMMLKFREDRVKQLEMFISGSISAQEYLVKENKALKEEIHLLHARLDRNPELTRFALENIRLLEQLQLYQNFYEQGERETLLTEIAELRNQLLGFLEGRDKASSSCNSQFFGPARAQSSDIAKELEDCRKMNSRLIGKVEELETELRKCLTCNESALDSVRGSASKDSDEFRPADKYSLVEAVSIRSDFGDEMDAQADEIKEKIIETVTRRGPTNDDELIAELTNARSLIEALNSEKVQLLDELQLAREQIDRYREILRTQNRMDRQYKSELEGHFIASDDLEKRNRGAVESTTGNAYMEFLQVKLEKLSKDLEGSRLLNYQYEEEHTSRFSHKQEVELVSEQVETEAVRTILQLQEEVASLQSELQERLSCMNQENRRLKNIIAVNEIEITTLSQEWEKATRELTSFIVDGCKSLNDASVQIETVVSSFPHVNAWISEDVKKAARACIEKEETILSLQKSLEDARKLVAEMNIKLDSLKGATIALSEIKHQDTDAGVEKALQYGGLLNERDNKAMMLENKLKLKEEQVLEAEKQANAAYLVVKWLSDSHKVFERDNAYGNTCTSLPAALVDFGNNMSIMEAYETNLAIEDNTGVELEKREVHESIGALSALFEDIKVHLKGTQIDLFQCYTEHKDMLQHVLKEVHEMRLEIFQLKENDGNLQSTTYTLQSNGAPVPSKIHNRYQMLSEIKGELAQTNEKLNIIQGCFDAKAGTCLSKDGYSSNGMSAVYASSASNSSHESSYPDNVGVILSACCVGRDVENLGRKWQGCFDDKTRILQKTIRKELDDAFDGFRRLYVQSNTLFNDNSLGTSDDKDFKDGDPYIGLQVESAITRCEFTSSEIPQKLACSSSFFKTFEEGHATMKEANLMLNALVEANENAKYLSEMWQQAAEELMVEKASLLKELEQLKSLIAIHEGENLLLQNQVFHDTEDLANSVSMLEACFHQTEKEVEELLKVLYSNVLLMGQEIHHSICSTRSSLEHACSQIVEMGFYITVLHMCWAGECFDHIPERNETANFHHFWQQIECSKAGPTDRTHLDVEIDAVGRSNRYVDGGHIREKIIILEDGEVDQSENNMIYENLSLRKKLERTEALLEGLLFDFSLLQESASNKKDIRDEFDKLIMALRQVREELELKTSQVDDLLVKEKKLERRLIEMEKSLFMSTSDFDQAKERVNDLAKQNAELIVLVEDLSAKKTLAEEAMEEQKEVIKGLENEILSFSSSVKKELLFSVKAIEEDLRKVTGERDQLLEDMRSLNDKLEMAYALVDEKEAAAFEARQESEASKIYAEQKEDEVKILECSVEELEYTINVLERRVSDMDEEVERHHSIRESLEKEIQTLRHRLLKVEDFADMVDSTKTFGKRSKDQASRYQELEEAQNLIERLEKEQAGLKKEIKQYQEYVSEILLHSEAQASQYQEKYKTLEACVQGVKSGPSSSTAAAPIFNKSERSSSRTRGSSSPFRCIAGLVQQMNLEKDQELSMARLQIQELEALLSSTQKEICTLKTRLAAAESMTHDVIRDLLGVKLDMTNYANLIDQCQVQKLVEDSHWYAEQIISKEQEIFELKKHIDALREERDSCVSDINKREADILNAEIALEQLRERDQLLSAQNEMLKMDKTNLMKKVAELDHMVKTFESEAIDRPTQLSLKMKDSGPSKPGNHDYPKRTGYPGRALSLHDELAQYRRSSNINGPTRSHSQGSETKYRRPRA